MNVVLGPNGIGKSSLVRAMASLLWKDGAAGAQVIASATLGSDAGEYAVVRELTSWRWKLDGADCDAPRLPASHLEGCFFLGLRDLLDDAQDAGKDVAQAIREQMAGGYDLAAISVAGEVERKTRKGKAARAKFAESEAALRKTAAGQKALDKRLAGLVGLQAGIEKALIADRKAKYIEVAVELQRERVVLAECEAALGEFPIALEGLTGGESRDLEQLESDLEGKRKQYATLEEARERTRAKALATRLKAPIDGAFLRAVKVRAERLGELESQAAQAVREWRETQALLARASKRVGGFEEPPAELSLADTEGLFSFLRDVQKVATECGVVEARLSLLDEGASFGEGGELEKRMQRGVDQLRIWLRSPDPATARTGVEQLKPGNIPAVPALALIVLGVVLALAIDPWLLLIAGVGMGLLLSNSVLRMIADRMGAPVDAPELPDRRALAQAEFPAGVDGPKEWDQDAVAERLQVLEDGLAESRAGHMHAVVQDTERKTLQSRMEKLSLSETELEARRQVLAHALGLEEIPHTAELVERMHAMAALHQARAAEAQAEAGQLGKAGLAAKLLLALVDDFAQLGELAPTEAIDARARVEDLEERDRILRGSLDIELEHEAGLTRLLDEIETLEGRIAGIFTGADLEQGDRTGLKNLVEQLGLFKRAALDKSVAAKTIARTESQLSEAGEKGLIEMDGQSITLERERVEKACEGLEEKRQEISEIQSEARHARAGHSVEEGLLAKDTALTALEICREGALQAAACNFLMESVRTEYDTGSMPEVLKRARELFASFTHHKYELAIAPDAGTSFVAREANSGKDRHLNELSDGTRIQLALAARLAFVEQAEQGHKLPLFLDEALDHSDAERFHAIARGLARMIVEDGRQMFYLTSDPMDAERLQAALREEGAAPAKIVDLAQVRGGATSVRSAVELEVAPRPNVLAPGELSAAEYGAALAVPYLDPRRGGTDQHLFYLLGDDLSLLHKLLELQFERTGQWLSFQKSGGPIALALQAESKAGAELAVRVDLLAVFCGAWLEGRGRSVDRVAIEASKVVSATFTDKVAALAQELGGNPVELIAALRARENPLAKRFPEKAAEGLERYLIDEEFLDDRPTLNESEVMGRALDCPAASLLQVETTTRLLHLWWELSH